MRIFKRSAPLIVPEPGIMPEELQTAPYSLESTEEPHRDFQENFLDPTEPLLHMIQQSWNLVNEKLTGLRSGDAKDDEKAEYIAMTELINDPSINSYLRPNNREASRGLGRYLGAMLTALELFSFDVSLLEENRLWL
jgi:hypothetical protein